MYRKLVLFSLILMLCATSQAQVVRAATIARTILALGTGMSRQIPAAVTLASRNPTRFANGLLSISKTWAQIGEGKYCGKILLSLDREPEVLIIRKNFVNKYGNDPSISAETWNGMGRFVHRFDLHNFSGIPLRGADGSQYTALRFRVDRDLLRNMDLDKFESILKEMADSAY